MFSQAIVSALLSVEAAASSQKYSATSQDKIASSFEHWKTTFLEEIVTDVIVADPHKSDGAPDKRPSEGMGYGMLFSAWLADDRTFDSLANSLYVHYVNKRGESEGLPAWAIDSEGIKVDNNSASDADLDIAVALIKRYKDTGNQEYMAKAVALLHKIKEKEVVEKEGLLVLKPSSGFGVNDTDGSITINPSYFAVGYFDVFSEIDAENAGFWKKLKTDSYKILNAVYDKYQKFPDWARINVGTDGKISVDKDFVHGERGAEELYDGIRTYWRIATDAVWNNDPRAKALLFKATRGKTPESVTFDGMKETAIGVFMYGAGAAGSGDKALADAFKRKTDEGLACGSNRCYFQLDDNNAEQRYYNQSLSLLAKLLIDGKFTRP